MEVPAARLAELDRYEGYSPGNPSGSLFVRARTVARPADGAPLDCWIYWYAGPSADRPEVPGGDWERR